MASPQRCQAELPGTGRGRAGSFGCPDARAGQSGPCAAGRSAEAAGRGMAPLQGPQAGREEPGAGASPRRFTWEEIGLRTGRGQPQQERWLVINRKVYDISQFYRRHPGGARVISSYAGQDATDPFEAFHIDKELVRKYMSSLLIGELELDQPSFEPAKNKLLVEDFRELNTTVERMGLLNSSHLFFFLLLLHIVLLEAAGWFVLWSFGTSPVPFLISAVLLTMSQSQAGFLQHDLGHLSVFSNTKWNHLFHEFVMSHLKGLSACWWSLHHSQHHAKPNCFHKDPDISMHPFLFTLGKTLSVELGLKKKKFMPYNYQHKYFFITMPLLVVPVFQLYSIYFIVQRKLWRELAWTLTYFIRFFFFFEPLLGVKGVLGLLLLLNVAESILFTWISQMNHIPMHIDYDSNMDWFSTQLQATCNVNQSLFNDWFTGHLNFQIEHHLFPRMPRHNYWKVAPLVKSLCAKHGIEYQSKPLLTGFADILRIFAIMAAPGSMANGVLVFIPPNNTGILQQGQGVSGAISQTSQMVQYGPQQFRVMDPGNQPLGSTYSGSAGDQVAHLRKVGMMERFLKAQPKTLGAIQILTGLMHIGFSAVCAIFIGYYIPISFIGGYPFWGGFSFIISGSLSVAAEKHHKSCLVKGSLGMNITSAIFSAIGIILLLTELIINASFERHSWLGGAKGITAMLFLLTVLEFCIAVSTSHFASEALCYTPSDSMLYVPYVVNANVVVPAPQITSPQMAAPPPYSNVAYDPKEEMEHRAA